MRFYQELPNKVLFAGNEYKLNLSYTHVLAMFDCLNDDLLTDTLKLQTALNLVVTDKHPNEIGLLINIIELLGEDKKTGNSEKTFDMIQDWSFIVSSFQQAYGIDLTEDKTMHYFRFKALLIGLPSDTKLAQVIKIRTMQVPEATKHNAQHIAEITRLKAIYALKSNDGGGFSSGLEKLFKTLKQRAVVKNVT